MVWTVLGHGLHIYLSGLFFLGVLSYQQKKTGHHVGEYPSLRFSCDERHDQKQLEKERI